MTPALLPRHPYVPLIAELPLQGSIPQGPLKALFIYFVLLFIEEVAKYSERTLGVSGALEF